LKIFGLSENIASIV